MRLFRRNWVKTTGRVIDSRVRRINMSQRAGTFSLHNYIVELRAPNGELKRLEVEQQIWAVTTEIGHEVPLLVKPDGTKAVIDKSDPRVNVNAIAKARQEAGKERFRNQLGD